MDHVPKDLYAHLKGLAALAKEVEAIPEVAKWNKEHEKNYPPENMWGCVRWQMNFQAGYLRSRSWNEQDFLWLFGKKRAFEIKEFCW